MKPTEEQIKKVWEWCGWRQLAEGKRGFHYERTQKVMNWLAPDDVDLVYGHPYLPRIDLNSLFKWAVPKVIAKLESRFDTKENLIRGLALLFDRWLRKISENYSLEDALFWAIYKVMEAADIRQ